VTHPGAIAAGQVVLITGGTRGIGLATAEVFASHGAQTVLTYKWGSANLADVERRIVDAGGPVPLILQADVSRAEDTTALLQHLRDTVGRVDVLISNASEALVVNSMDDYSARGFLKSMQHAAWPTFGYLQGIHEILGAYPRYVVIMSSDGPDRFTPGYDFVAAAKAATETLTRYLSYRLRHHGVRINVVRSRAVKTESFDDTFGNEFMGFLETFVPPNWAILPSEVGRAAFALCSGLCDGVSGQVLMVDRGNTFADGISFIYERREALGL
jgi:NAD(P)-dependent dehydrogenase (short-subunit alcohol dehydrogenase family)